MTKGRILTIVGPTASGKTSLAIDIAKKFNGEIICADSRTIYKGLSIGTAKPSLDEMRGVPHWGLDLVNPGERFTVADFQEYAINKINEIQECGRLPIVVGGTGLYVDALIFGYKFDNDNQGRLQDFSRENNAKNYNAYGNFINIKNSSNNYNNNLKCSSQDRESMKINAIVVGIATEKQILNNRIIERSKEIFRQNVVEEATKVAEKFGWDNVAMTGNIYPIIKKYKAGEIYENQMFEQFCRSDIRLAKRQMTWFRKNPYVVWSDLETAQKYIEDKLGEA